jgi:UDP-3-O-[3-hydroxymyristoyl] glucosamine N-acyltransferase
LRVGLYVSILGTTSIQGLMTIGRRKKIETKIVVKNKAVILVKVL